MKFGVVIFPGSNCDEDMVYVLQEIMGFPVERLWHKERDLKGCDFVVLPGGFTYGDYLRSGAIAPHCKTHQKSHNKNTKTKHNYNRKIKNKKYFLNT